MPKSGDQAAEEVRLLFDIKRLLIVQLLRDGASNVEIGRALEISESRVRQLVTWKRSQETRKPHR